MSPKEITMHLNESDQKYLLRFKRNVKTIYINYIVAIIFIIVAIIKLIIGIKFNIERYFYLAIMFGSIGIFMLIVSRVYQRLNRIILNLENAQMKSDKL